MGNRARAQTRTYEFTMLMYWQRKVLHMITCILSTHTLGKHLPTGKYGLKLQQSSSERYKTY
ncbi:hypothetical protein PILCRDRAFT_718084 [Piloderma croceum F 1598]|uniref:Uncharacterized protein n=1 Tax=Piloderma croceum (strain F 1598) TaxID=765440 RepID=A0A0C3AJ22_PILCF|nr:hypothetical protein PILCRDRAFT_718084 [Piloderma croceum F 1598]